MPLARIVGTRIGRESIDRLANLGDGRRQFDRPRRRLAAPERNRRRGAARVFDQHASGSDAPDAPGRIAEQEDVAGHALDGEVLVDGADDVALGMLDDVVQGGVGNGAAAGDRGEPRASSGPAAGRSPDRDADTRRSVRGARRSLPTASRSRHRNRPAADRGRDTRAGPARTVRPRRQSAAAQAATICCARMSSGASGTMTWSSSPRPIASTSAAHSIRSSRVVGNSRAFGVAPRQWPARPMRCTATAIDRVDAIWHTRSIVPTSMPSSSDAVATTTLSSPVFRRCSASRRVLRDRLP